jgi:hypothetical protein
MSSGNVARLDGCLRVMTASSPDALLRWSSVGAAPQRLIMES